MAKEFFSYLYGARPELSNPFQLRNISVGSIDDEILHQLGALTTVIPRTLGTQGGVGFSSINSISVGTIAIITIIAITAIMSIVIIIRLGFRVQDLRFVVQGIFPFRV